MSLIDVLVLIAAFGVLGAFLCRLDSMHIRTDPIAVVAMHVGIAGAIFAAGVHAWAGQTDVQDACVVIAGGSWIASSLRTWRVRMRSFAETEPAPIELADYRKVSGGRRETSA